MLVYEFPRTRKGLSITIDRVPIRHPINQHESAVLVVGETFLESYVKIKTYIVEEISGEVENKLRE